MGYVVVTARRWGLKPQRMPAKPPNDALVYSECADCHKAIYEGESIVTFDGDAYHYACFIPVAVDLMQRRYGAAFSIARLSCFDAPMDGVGK